MQRNLLLSAICKLFLLVVFQVAMAGQWIQTNGPYGGIISGLAVDDSGVIAATSGGGIYRSTNNGKSWKALVSNLPYLGEVYALAVINGSIFIQISAGFFRSDDKGVTWNNLGAYIPSLATVRCLVAVEDTIFAGTIDGVYRSTDQGTIWNRVGAGLMDPDVTSLVIRGDKLFAGTFDLGVYLSTDRGVSWTVVDSGITDYTIRSLAVRGSTIYAGTEGGMYRSTNFGNSWTAVDPGLADFGASLLYVSGATIFSGTHTGIFRSTDDGISWAAVDSGISYRDIRCFTASKGSMFAGTNGGGAFVSVNDGTNWKACDSGIVNTSINALAVNGNSIVAGTNTGVYRSSDNGTNWTVNNAGLTNTYITTLAATDNAIFAGTKDGHVFRWTNDGNTWSSVFYDGSSGPGTYSLAISGPMLFAATNIGIYRSVDNGTTWIKADTGLAIPYNLANSLAVSGNNVFAAINNHWVYRSTDIGKSWNKVGSGMSSVNINCVFANGSNIFAGSYGGIINSVDNGTNWREFTFFDPTNVICFTASAGNVFAGTGYNGVSGCIFLKTDTAKTLTSVNFYKGVGALAVANGNLFAGTLGEGVWRRPLSEMIDIHNPQARQGRDRQATFRLLPRQYNKSNMAIEFFLQTSEKLAFSMTDLYGRTLVCNGYKEFEAGQHRIELDTRHMAQGIYAIQIQRGTNIFTKMIHFLQ